MKRITLILVFISIFILVTGCSGPASSPVAATDSPTAVVETPTNLPTPIPPTETPVPSPTPEPTATPLPGVETIKINEFSKSIPWLPIVTSARPSVNYIGFNMMKAPFNNPLVRQAFAAAIDRQAIVDIMSRLGSKNARPATNITPPEVLGRDLYGEVGIPFDPQKAKELFIKAGYSDPANFPVITLLTNRAGSEAPGAHQQVAEAMVKMWKDTLGVTVNFKVLTWNTFKQQIAENPPYLFRMGWTADYNDPDNFLREIFHTGGGTNYGYFRNSDFDSLVDQAEKETDPAARQALYIQAERILCEDQTAVIPLYHSEYNVP